MPTFYIVASSFSEPFLPRTTFHVFQAKRVSLALEAFRQEYKDPAGLYSANAYDRPEGYEQLDLPLARWMSNYALLYQKVTRRLINYVSVGHGSTKFVVNGKVYKVSKPKEGLVVLTPQIKLREARRAIPIPGCGEPSPGPQKQSA